MRVVKALSWLAVVVAVCGGLLWQRSDSMRRYRLSRDLWSAVDAADSRRVSALLDAGADPNVRENLTTRPATIAERLRSFFLGSAGHGAGCPAIVRAANEPEDTTGNIVRLLLDHGADPNVRCQELASPLGLACMRNHTRVIHV